MLYPTTEHLQQILSLKQRFTASKELSDQTLSNRGISLAEVLAALFIFGILGALSAPTLAGLQNRGRVNDAFNDLANSIREAQANAIQSSRTCTVTFNTTSSPVRITALDNQATPAPCIASRTLPTGVGVATNLTGTPPTLTFSFKGSTTNAGVLTVYWTQQPNLQKRCLSISNGIGIMRSGLYASGADPTTNVTANSCSTTP